MLKNLLQVEPMVSVVLISWRSSLSSELKIAKKNLFQVICLGHSISPKWNQWWVWSAPFQPAGTSCCWCFEYHHENNYHVHDSYHHGRNCPHDYHHCQLRPVNIVTRTSPLSWPMVIDYSHTEDMLIIGKDNIIIIIIIITVWGFAEQHQGLWEEPSDRQALMDRPPTSKLQCPAAAVCAGNTQNTQDHKYKIHILTNTHMHANFANKYNKAQKSLHFVHDMLMHI